MIFRAAAMLAVLASAAGAQQVSEAQGVILRGLDKISGQVYDIEMKSGQTATFERLRITLNSCRYPVGNPAGDAFAALEVSDATDGTELFSGWMIASAPALSAMDHARYDLWVMRCTTS
ncbi:DUF2155 domain-containing protein [Roseobacter sp. YSTF-M11]|uniref:DUF2155 domain-containing protein n=1 Tax=Roseobacter insulae TaxID=2859783 RepID=A0A9X1FYP7_9RHOB|nr:DUF2155 domain-containing protein [Roseobacter insulae]MBW4710169.1 DUF2155 domain-containing protein [Roseobacter insulae]